MEEEYLTDIQKKAKVRVKMKKTLRQMGLEIDNEISDASLLSIYNYICPNDPELEEDRKFLQSL